MEPLLTTREAAKLLGLSCDTLKRYRSDGVGPPFLRLGTRAIRYRPEDLREWAGEKNNPTAEAGEGG